MKRAYYAGNVGIYHENISYHSVSNAQRPVFDEGSLNCRITCYKRFSRVGICEDRYRLTLDYKIPTNYNFYLHISVERFGYFCVLG